MARFDAVGIAVSDMSRALAFYRLIGLSVPEGAETEGHVEVVIGGGLRLMFDTEEVVRSFDAGWDPGTCRGRIGLAFLCDGPVDVDDTVERVVAAGHTVATPPFDAFWGQRYATVLDPDGNPVDLFAPLER